MPTHTHVLTPTAIVTSVQPHTEFGGLLEIGLTNSLKPRYGYGQQDNLQLLNLLLCLLDQVA
jgi:hypothetical protein